MDSDDISLFERFAKQVEILDINNCIDITSSNCQFIDCNNQLYGVKTYPETDSEIREAIWYRNPILHPGVMLRKKCFSDL